MTEEIQPGDLVRCIGRTKNSEVNNKVGLVLEVWQVEASERVLALILIDGEKVIRKNVKNIIKLQ